MLGEGRVIVESDGLAEGRMDSAEHSEHDGYGLGGSFSAEPCGKRHAGFAFMENEHGPRALADNEVTFPMANISAGFDVLWPIMDGGAVFNYISEGLARRGLRRL